MPAMPGKALPKNADRPTNGNAVPAVVRPTTIRRGLGTGGHKLVIYGPGGVGKTALCSLLPQVGVEPLFIDLDDGTRFIDVARLEWTPRTFDEVRAVLHDQTAIEPFGAVVIDSFTKLEELAIASTLENVPHEKGHHVNSIEGYGWGKGYTHTYETFLTILGDLDAISRTGRHVIGVCHDCTANVPNPAGEDWIRWEPRMQSPPSGKGSIRHRIKEWSDHLLFIGFDQAVNVDGKAIGSGTRTIYPTELPTHWAKSRTLREPIPFVENDPKLWQLLLGKAV